MSEVIGENEMDVRMKRVPEWEIESESIIRVVEYDDFMDAIDFVNGVAEIAEEAQHYPEINILGSLVTLRLTSEDHGGVTSLDFELAGRIDHLLD